MNGQVRQVAVAISALVMVIINSVVNVGGVSVKAVSDRYFNAVTPADYTFAVWGPIFLGALALAAYQALPAQRRDPQLDALGWPLTITYAATALWPPAWQTEHLGLSLLLIVIMLLGLIAAYLKVIPASGRSNSRAFTWMVRVPVVLFFGWITAATIVNTTVWLLSRGWTNLGPSADVWAAALLLVAAGLGVIVVRRSAEVVYGLVLIWATWGIVAAHPGASATVVGAVTGSALVLAATAWSLMLRRRAARPRSSWDTRPR